MANNTLAKRYRQTGCVDSQRTFSSVLQRPRDLGFSINFGDFLKKLRLVK